MHAAQNIVKCPAALQVTSIGKEDAIIWFLLKSITIFLQLRYLQTLNNIAAENNSTVVFPVPMDLFTKMVEVIPDTSGDELGE